MARQMLDLLLTCDDEGEAIKNLRVLRKQIRKDPITRTLFDLAPARNPGRPPGITLAKTSYPGEYFLVAAVRADIKKADLLYHLFQEPDPEGVCKSTDHSHFDFSKKQKPEDRRYRWLRRLEKALGLKIPSAYIDDLKHMDYKTRLDYLKPNLSLFCFPA